MKYVTKKIKEGINLHLINTNKFKTNIISVFLTKRLKRDSVTKEALIPAVLRLGTNNIKTQKEIGKKLVGNLSEIIKIFNLYKMNLQRNKDLKKIMLSIKCIFEEIIILTLVIEGIMKVNLWSLIYFIYIFYLVFTKMNINVKIKITDN